MLLLVDIDGTLLRVESRRTRQIWSDAWAEVIGAEVPWHRLDSAAGKTDLQILAQLIGDATVAQSIAPRFFDALAERVEQWITADTVTLLPNAEEFLRHAQRIGATLAVLSGNERRCGWHKLRVAGLDAYFVEGFFGCEAIERTHLPPRALRWAYSSQVIHPLAPVVVIGDTPNDIACARDHGLWSFAVATGPYSYGDLTVYQPSACFYDLGGVAVSLHRLAIHHRMAQHLIIAIDGPAGSGKTTTARLLAERLGYTYIDTGAMYRALTLAALEQGVPLTDDALAALLQRITIELRHTATGQRTFLNGQDVSERIRQSDITAHVSRVSAFPSVRDAMVRLQQELGKAGGVVMDGRDIGTVVFPNADVKVFMTADLDTRAQRRWKELQATDPQLTLEEVKQQLAQRDKLDSSRAYHPLRQADDAFVLDTTNLSVEEQVEQILRYIRRRMQERFHNQLVPNHERHH